MKEETNFWKSVGPIAPVAKGQQNIATIGKGSGENSISMSCPHPILGTPGPEIIITQSWLSFLEENTAQAYKGIKLDK